MNMHSLRALAATVLATSVVWMASVVPASASTLEQVFAVADQILKDARSSQTKIDGLTESDFVLAAKCDRVLAG